MSKIPSTRKESGQAPMDVSGASYLRCLLGPQAQMERQYGVRMLFARYDALYAKLLIEKCMHELDRLCHMCLWRRKVRQSEH